MPVKSDFGRSQAHTMYVTIIQQRASPQFFSAFSSDTEKLTNLSIWIHFICNCTTRIPSPPLLSRLQRGAHGVILVYDVSKRETFEALKDVWLKEVSMYSTRSAAVKMVVGNKVDIEERQVSREEGLAFARQQSTLFVESSAKTASGVQQTFEELLRKILETPQLCTSDSSAGNIQPSASGQGTSYAESCSC